MNRPQRLRTITSFLVVISAIALVYKWHDAPTKTGQAGAGDQSAAVAGAVPNIPVASIVTEKSTGHQFVSNELIVEFSPSLPEADALSLITSVGGEMIARTTAKPVFHVRIAADKGDGAGTTKAVKLLENDNRVIHAELNYITTIAQ